MQSTNNQSFNFLGQSFQLKLLSQLFSDRKFSERILSVIQTKYFDNMNYRQIVVFIKDYYEKYENIPTYDNIMQTISIEIKDDIQKEYLFEIVKEIKKQTLEDSRFVQDRSLKFCKQQALKKALQYCNKVLERGDFEEYDKLEGKLKEVLDIGEENDDGIDVMSGLEDVLSENFRRPIPTGIDGIDKNIEGGLSKGELGVIFAGPGGGKTTILTKISNTGKNLGYNVLQIIFEDSDVQIRRKHFSCWTGIQLNDLSKYKDKVIEKINILKKENNKFNEGRLQIKRFPSGTVTINKIKNYIKRQISVGFKPDIVILDYLECILPNERIEDINTAEGSIIRSFESMLFDLDMVGWCGLQGNRSSISSDIVRMDQMGGSIKRAQVGHLVISIAKSLQQKELGLATIAILKSRFGRDGIVFENCTFDNSRVYINTNKKNIITSFDYENNKEENIVSKNRESVMNAIERMKKIKEEKEQNN